MPDFSSLQDVEAAEAMEGHGPPPDLLQNTYEMIHRNASLNPQVPVLNFFLSVNDHRISQTWSYVALPGRTTQIANFFDSIGVKKDSAIALVLSSLLETHLVIWGGRAVGTVAAFSPLLEGPALAELLNAVGVSILVTLAPLPGTGIQIRLQPHLPAIKNLQHLVLVNLADRVHDAAQCAAQMQKNEAPRLLGPQSVHGAVPMSVRIHDFDSAVQVQRANGLNNRRHIAVQGASLYFCTGGTTGLLRITMHTRGNEIVNAWNAAQVLRAGIGPGRVMFCGLPLFHINDVLVIGLLPSSRGAHVMFGTPQGCHGDGVIQRLWEIVGHHRVSSFSGVPTFYTSLLQVSAGECGVRLSEYGLCSTASVPVEVFRRFQRQADIKTLEGYRLMEATCVSGANPPMGECRLGSIGLHVPMQQMKTIVLDEDGVYLRGRVVNEVDVLVASDPSIFSGYRRAGRDEGLQVDTGDGQRWLDTDDLTRQGEQDYFQLTGRKKELIIRDGRNIDPLTVEVPPHRYPAAQIAAAVGRPDVHAGELPVVYMQPRADVSATEANLLVFLKVEIAGCAALSRQVDIIEAMPLTTVDKIFKPTLKHRETRDALSAILKDAGITLEALEVVEDKSRGLVVSVRLDASVSIAVAREVLGRFSFPFFVN